MIGHPHPHLRPAYYSKISINRAFILRFFRTIDWGLPAIMDDTAMVIPYAMGRYYHGF